MKARICIRQSIGEYDTLIFYFEVVLELQLKRFLFKSISANSLGPIDLKAPLLAPLSINERVGPHAMSIQIFPFSKITNVKLYLSQLLFVIDFKIKPSSMSSCISVTP